MAVINYYAETPKPIDIDESVTIAQIPEK